MASDRIHDRILNQAARHALAPMGLVQKGRSRLWLDDRGMWVTVVEFTPSGFSRGSGLTVALSFLWHPDEVIAFNHRSTAQIWEAFRNEQQWLTACGQLAQLAARHVQQLRAKLPSMQKLFDYHRRQKDHDGFWHWMDAGIMATLLSRPRQAQEYLARTLRVPPEGRQWVMDAQQSALELSALSDDLDLFQKKILEKVTATRSALKLPPLA